MPERALPFFEAHVGVREELALEVLLLPFKVSEKFIFSEMLHQPVTQTNRYYCQLQADAVYHPAMSQCPWVNLTVLELKTWLGIVLTNAHHSYPSMHLNWSSEKAFSSPHVQEITTCLRFEQIKRCLHLADSSKEPTWEHLFYDPLYKSRP